MVLVASEKAGTACLDVFKIVQGWHLGSWTGAVVLLLVHGSIQAICTTLEMAIGAIWLLQPFLKGFGYAVESLRQCASKLLRK